MISPLHGALAAFAISCLLAGCGPSGRVVDSSGNQVSRKTLRAAEAEVAASGRKKSAMQRQADIVLLNADFRRQTGRDGRLTPLERSVVAGARYAGQSSVDARQNRLKDRFDLARREMAMRRANPARTTGTAGAR